MRGRYRRSASGRSYSSQHRVDAHGVAGGEGGGEIIDAICGRAGPAEVGERRGRGAVQAEDRGGAAERDAAELVAADPERDEERGQREEIGEIGDEAGAEAEDGERAAGELGERGVELDGGEDRAGGEDAEEEAPAREARIEVGAGGVEREAEEGGEDDGREGEAGDVAELAGDGRERGRGVRLGDPVIEEEERDRGEGHGMQRFADGEGGSQGAIAAAQRAADALEDRGPTPIALLAHPYTLPVVSETGKQSESAKQLAAAENEAKERFEKAMTELREGAYRFSSRARGQSELIIEELIDPEGETVASIADVEGDQGAGALAQSLELITFDTWLFGQIGDKDELDLKNEDHWEVWFSYGAWIGETMRRRHGGHWLLMGDDPHTWRVGFSKVFLEIAPFVFAEQLLRTGSGATRKMVSEIERIRQLHEEQRERDKGQSLDRFLSQHYIRLHTVPLGQWMAMDFARLAKLWNEEPVAKLIEAIKESGPRLGPSNQQIVEQVVQAISRANQEQPLAKQTNDRGLFEAIAQIVALRRATAPLAIDILERVVMPALHVGLPEKFPPLDEDDLANLRKQVELFAFFVEVVPHKFQADDEGFLGTIPHEELTTPYADRNVLEIGKGDWVVVNPGHFAPMLAELNPDKLLEKYDEFVKYIASIPDAPRRRDDGRMLAETAIRALADLKGCVATAAQNKDVLLFRLLPPPG